MQERAQSGLRPCPQSDSRGRDNRNICLRRSGPRVRGGGVRHVLRKAARRQGLQNEALGTGWSIVRMFRSTLAKDNRAVED